MCTSRYFTSHWDQRLGEAIAQEDHADLPQRVLVEPLDDEGSQILQRQLEPVWTEILVPHRLGQVDNDVHVPHERPAQRRLGL